MLKTADLYASSQELLGQGVNVLWNMSLEAAYVKLIFAYANFEHEAKIDEFMLADIAFEHVENN